MEVLMSIEEGTRAVDAAELERLAVFAMERLGLPQSAEVSVSFVSDGTIAALNEEYRGKAGPTDVLSFECDGLDDGFPIDEGGSAYALGDILIAPEVAYRQAHDLGERYEDELALLLVHGVLHLCGYDHIDDDEARVMEEQQRKLLAQWRASSAEGGC